MTETLTRPSYTPLLLETNRLASEIQAFADTLNEAFGEDDPVNPAPVIKSLEDFTGAVRELYKQVSPPGFIWELDAALSLLNCASIAAKADLGTAVGAGYSAARLLTESALRLRDMTIWNP